MNYKLSYRALHVTKIVYNHTNSERLGDGVLLTF
jgi:hypothetical protein